ncbi:MAG: hypothetical protein R3F02_15500 [Thiolinea sp.]
MNRGLVCFLVLLFACINTVHGSGSGVLEYSAGNLSNSVSAQVRITVYVPRRMVLKVFSASADSNEAVPVLYSCYSKATVKGLCKKTSSGQQIVTVSDL